MPELDETATLEAAAPTPATGLDVSQKATTPAPVSTEPPVEGEEQAETEERYEVSDEDRASPLAKALKGEAFREAQSQFEKTRQKHVDEAVSKLNEDHQYALSQFQTAAARERDQAVQHAIATAGIGEISKLITTASEGFESEEAAGAFFGKLFSNPTYRDWARAFSGAVEQEGHQQGYGAGITKASTLIYHGLSAEQTRELERFVVIQLQPKLARRELTTEQAIQQQLDKRDEIMRADVEAKLEKLSAERQTAEERANGRKEKAPPAANIAGRGGGIATGADILEKYNTGQMGEAEFREHQKAGRVDLSFST